MVFHRFYRFDFAVTQIFQDFNDKYYGVTISAHLLAYTPKSVIQLLSQVKKPFFVDPMTFVFARDINNIGKNGKLKKSYMKLLENYGSVFAECNKTKLKSSTFVSGTRVNTSIIVEVCNKVIGFQKSKFTDIANFSKYQRILKKEVVDRTLNPSFLVAPYFYCETADDEWYRISLECARTSKRLFPAEEIYPIICMSKDFLLEEDQISKVVRDYEGFPGYLIWIDNLDEEKITASQLNGLKRFVVLLSRYGKPIYSLYGGFLMDLVRRFGLTGYSSGICYGEKRSVDAVGGGAGNRYYMPAAHLKVSQEIADALFRTSKNNLRLMCNCSFCTELRKDIPDNLEPSEYSGKYMNEILKFLDFRRHFVVTKFEESERIDSSSVKDITDWLESDLKSLSEIDSFPKITKELRPQHINTWLSLFKSSI